MGHVLIELWSPIIFEPITYEKLTKHVPYYFVFNDKRTFSKEIFFCKFDIIFFVKNTYAIISMQ